jgi:hypothetical protein
MQIPRKTPTVRSDWVQLPQKRRKEKRMKYIKEVVKNLGFSILMAVIAVMTLYPIALTLVS